MGAKKQFLDGEKGCTHVEKLPQLRLAFWGPFFKAGARDAQASAGAARRGADAGGSPFAVSVAGLGRGCLWGAIDHDTL